MGSRRTLLWLIALVVALTAACGEAGGGTALDSPIRATAITTTTTATTVPPTTVPAPASTAAVPTPVPTAAPATTTPRPPRPRVVHEQPWVPFAVVGQVVLHHPSARVELVGFHESNHDGAQQLDALPTAAAPTTLESRERDTGGRGAADVVSDPAAEVRSPVTGRVKRGGTYVLYCKHRDDFVVIEPDGRPGWEVKVLHINGLMVRAGDRVVAGETVLAPRPTQLPFESQVDEVSAEPHWPHVHIEVVDPSVPDRPGKGC